MTKFLRWFALTLAVAFLGIVQPLASAWACDPCPTPKKPDYSASVPADRP
jgi:hypothetical protein